MNIGNTRAVYLFHSLWFLAPNRFTWKMAFYLKPPETGKPRALAEVTLMVDILSLSEHTGRNRVL
jgi:hypothetical protein